MIEESKRQLDGRTLYVLMIACEYLCYSHEKTVPVVTVGEIKSALANARYVLEQVKFEVKE